MADCRFISRFDLTDANKIRIDHSAVSPINITLAADTYFWSLDEDTTAGQRDLAGALVTALDSATGPGVTWAVDLNGVSYTSDSDPAGAVRITCSSGTFTVKWSDTSNTTIDPRIMGWEEEHTDDEASTGTELVSPYAARYCWQPQREVFDPDPMSSRLTLSQAMSSAGRLSTVYFSTVEIAGFSVQFVLAALVSSACGENADRAALANLAEEDPNASWEIFYIDAVTGQREIRVYSAIDEFTDEDFDGPYYVTTGTTTQINSLGTARRPLPGKADLYNVTINVVEVV